MKKRNHEIFGVFQNLETRFKNISPRKKKKFLGEIFLREISFQILEKIQDFIFVIFIFPWVLTEIFFLLEKISTRFGLQFGISSFPCLKNTFFLQISFINSLEISTITIGSRVRNPLLRAASSPIVKPSNFLPFNSMYLFKRFVFSS